MAVQKGSLFFYNIVNKPQNIALNNNTDVLYDITLQRTARWVYSNSILLGQNTIVWIVQEEIG